MTDAMAAIVAALPPYTADPVERLRHVLAAHPHARNDEGVLMATMNAYPDANWTGVTFGDLRAILALLDGRDDDKATEYWRGVDAGRLEVMNDPSTWMADKRD